MTSPPASPLSSSTPRQETYGLVAWVDVLGFKQLLNKEPSLGLEIWKTVWGFLTETHEIFEEHGSTDHQRGGLVSFQHRFRFTAFSDSIAASLDLSGVTEEKTALWNPEWQLMRLFLLRMAYLTRRLFDFGLPARGVVDCGGFYHSDIGFGGMPFVCAEGESNKLEFSASIITNAAAGKLDEAYDLLPHSSRPWFEHKIETKCDVNGRTFRILNAYKAGLIKATNDASEFERPLNDGNIEQTVMEVFAAHGKPIADARVKEKITKTIQMLKTAQKHSPQFFL